MDERSRKRLAQHIRERRQALRLSETTATKRAGFGSRNTWAGAEDGTRDLRTHNYAGVETALEWSAGSVERILAGGDPEIRVRAGEWLGDPPAEAPASTGAPPPTDNLPGVDRHTIGDYYDRHQASKYTDLPEDGQAHLRATYIDGVLDSPEAQRQIAEILRREWCDRRTRNNVRYDRIAIYALTAAQIGSPLTSDWPERIAEIIEALQRIVVLDNHPDDVDAAHAALASLGKMWLGDDAFEKLWLLGDDPAEL